MSLLTAILLGIVQGIAEFLPISSSGHLALLQNIFHIDEAGLMFDVMLHLGTLLSVYLVYRNDVRGLFCGGLSLIGMGKEHGKRTPRAKRNRHRAIFVVIGTLPLLLVLPIKGTIESLAGNTVFVGIMLLVNGFILHLADRHYHMRKLEEKISLLDVLLIGLGQALAVIPGISRSGTTISVSMFRGIDRSFAVKFSFLLSIPAVLGALLLELVEAVSAGFDVHALPMYLAGMIASAIAGYFSIRLLRYAAARSRFGSFAYYCWGAGIVSLLLSLIA